MGSSFNALLGTASDLFASVPVTAGHEVLAPKQRASLCLLVLTHVFCLVGYASNDIDESLQDAWEQWSEGFIHGDQLDRDVKPPPDVASFIKQCCLFVTFDPYPKRNRPSLHPLPRIGLGSRALREGDRLMVLRHPRAFRYYNNIITNEMWHFPSFVVRPTWSLIQDSVRPSYRLVGHATIFSTEDSPFFLSTMNTLDIWLE